ncbi:uncharacterized protein LOC123844083 [Mirounga angustirostris]|uniref:uncharacterized protein LOC123844083 n=1 Tax=Mirounga angustirostris TaxID=9716 RepID=UPI0023E38D85|nr:uncharacterized protein LOC123844083 [Mirounga angustirostris]XP_054363233.1 uncharacterized protein LOC123844083 [Mirounga angustirostris]
MPPPWRAGEIDVPRKRRSQGDWRGSLPCFQLCGDSKLAFPPELAILPVSLVSPGLSAPSCPPPSTPALLLRVKNPTRLLLRGRAGRVRGKTSIKCLRSCRRLRPWRHSHSRRGSFGFVLGLNFFFNYDFIRKDCRKRGFGGSLLAILTWRGARTGWGGLLASRRAWAAETCWNQAQPRALVCEARSRGCPSPGGRTWSTEGTRAAGSRGSGWLEVLVSSFPLIAVTSMMSGRSRSFEASSDSREKEKSRSRSALRSRRLLAGHPRGARCSKDPRPAGAVPSRAAVPRPHRLLALHSLCGARRAVGDGMLIPPTARRTKAT